MTDSQDSTRVSAPRERRPRARGETFYPGPSRIQLAAFPPKERWDDWVELDSRAWPRARRAALHARPDDLLQLRVGVRPARLRRPRDARRSASSRATPSTRARAGATAPRGRRPSTRSPTPTASSIRSSAPATRGEGRWERVSLGRGARRHRRPHPHGDRRGAPQRGHVPRRPARRGRLHRARARRLGRRRPQLAHQHLLVGRRAPATSCWMGIDRPSPDHANADVILLISSHLESGHYFNPHAQRIMEAKQRGAKLIVFDTRLSNTATHADHWLAPWPGLRGGDPPRDRQPPDPEPPLRPRVRAALVELAGVPGGASDPDEPATFEAFERTLARALRRVHLRVRRARVGRRRGGDRGGRRARRRRRHAARAPTPGAARPPATSAAGRSRARSSC